MAVTLSPRRRRLVLVLAVLLVVVAALAWWNRRTIGDVYGYVFPGGLVEDARERTSPAAPVASRTVPTVAPEPPPAPSEPDPSVALQLLVELPAPSAVVDPPGPGPVLVSTLDGRIHEVDLSDGTTRVVTDLSAHVSTGGERGLLGMALDPPAERLYVNFTNDDGDTEIRSFAIADGRPEGAMDDSVLHLYIGQPYRNHNGGNLVFGPDDALWIGVGDGGSAGDPAGVAQDPQHILGKMLRVVPDPSGGVRALASNPDWDGRPELWAVGLRNPWRYSFDRATNRLWVADVGQDAIEEVTVVDPDAARVNFGWDRLEGSRPFDGEPGSELTDPVVEYTHDDGCSIVGGYVYRGREVRSLRGWYVFGDYCGGWIRAVPSDDPAGAPVELLADAGSAISFAELHDGELLFLSSTAVWAVVGA